MVFIQETMAPAQKSCQYFLKLFPRWEVSAIDVVGLSGELLCAWNPSICDFLSYIMVAWILLIGHIKVIELELKLLNVYGPYSDWLPFWDRLDKSGLLRDPNLILGGDLNFITSPLEAWGTDCEDPLSSYFNTLFRNVGLVDMKPIDMGPTWRNGQATEAGISKRLDRFLVVDSLLPRLWKYRTWHTNSLISDHLQVTFQIEMEDTKRNYPFKFNHHWLEIPYFQSLVRDFWLADFGMGAWTVMDWVVEKLRLLKVMVRKWDCSQKKAINEQFYKILIPQVSSPRKGMGYNQLTYQ